MTTVLTRFVDGVAVLTLDNPPVNAGNIVMRRDLHETLLTAAKTPGLRGVVIDSAGRHFYAGSDISEFDRPLEEPQLPLVIQTIEELQVPVVAAVTGLALGGGFEVVLACDARVGDASARFGFPEVTLGILPGAGGTVRAGRLLGAAKAIDLVASARQIDAAEAHELGVLDEVVDRDALTAAAVALAGSLPGKRRLRELDAPACSEDEVEAAVAQATKRARPNVLQAVEMVRRGVSMDAAEALAEERAIFDALRVGEEAANLRYLFFAKRSAAGALKSGAKPVSVRRIGVAGGGTMGGSIAKLVVDAGYETTVFDLNEQALERLRERAPGVRTTRDLADLAETDLVIDAVFEDMEVKQQLLHDLEDVLSDEARIASNTSYLDLNDMASVMRRPQRFGGLHFFNPADRNPLVEVIRTSGTDDETFAMFGALAARLGKVAIPAGIGDGFVANRVYADYRTQAEFLVEDGASPQEVDAAMTGLGLAIGPFAVGDMSGLDIAWARRKRLAATRDPEQRYVEIPDRLCEAGRLGKKTGAGWYAYPDGARRGVPDPAVDRIIAEARAAKHLVPRAIDGEEIRYRILASMLCAAAGVVDSGVAQRASDVDVALTEGFAFPKWLGGPVRLLSALDEKDLVRWLAAVHESCPVTFAIAEPASRGSVPGPIREVLAQVSGTDQR